MRRATAIAGILRFTAGAIVCTVISIGQAGTPPVGTSVETHGLPGIRIEALTQSAPPLRCWVARVDLADTGMEVVVSRGGPDPDGPGPWKTELMTVPDIARRDGLLLAVNGDFFLAPNTKIAPTTGPAAAPAHGKYEKNAPASPVGVCLSDGTDWGSGRAEAAMLTVDAAGNVEIGPKKALPKGIRQAISGGPMLVSDGIVLTAPEQGATAAASTSPAAGKARKTSSSVRHPRTAVGLSKDGKTLILLVADGRSIFSSGLSERELADLMLGLGCDVAMNLDGGGSTTMTVCDGPPAQPTTLNHPSDGTERPVANVLGIRPKPAHPKAGTP